MIKIPTIWILEDANLPPIVRYIFKILNFIFRPNILVTSSIVSKYYLNHNKFNKKLRKIYAPVSLKNLIPKIITLKKLTEKIKILMVANLTKIKGIEVFLKIVKLSPDNYQFTLCGGIPILKKICKRINF